MEISNFEYWLFLSPLIYNLLLLITYIGSRCNIITPISGYYVKMHNYIMTVQSCVLLYITAALYYDISSSYNLPLYDFISISNIASTLHIADNNVYILNIFLFSKVYEWIDTVILIINKKPVITLHWWHHSTITVAFYTGFYSSSVLWIGLLNSFIHVIMYLYYADTSFIKPFAKYLTMLQIIQLAGGVYMNYISYFYNTAYKIQLFAIINGFICGSYFLLFLKFYSKKYKTKRTE